MNNWALDAWMELVDTWTDVDTGPKFHSILAPPVSDLEVKVTDFDFFHILNVKLLC